MKVLASELKALLTTSLSVATMLCLMHCAATSPRAQVPIAAPPPAAQPAMLPSLSYLAGLKPREQLPPPVRELLSARMVRHGDQLTDLMVYVVMLEYDLVISLASKLAAEPKLPRPSAGETGTLNALMPPAFFVHQDALADSSRALARAAGVRNDEQLVVAFADVTKSCVGCHTAYLQADFEPMEHDEPGEKLPCELGDYCASEGDGERLSEP